MNLQNKKTGILGCITSVDPEKITVWGGGNDSEYSEYTTLSGLCEDWEDAPEEPKKHYEILAMGAVMEREDAEDEIFRNQGQREIGNYFETQEEAEKAVEKLKAWKRLKEIEIFTYIDHISFLGQEGNIKFEFHKNLTPEEMKEADKDLKLLFGGEE